MNIPSLFKYKLDYTGKDPENLVVGEKHHVEHGSKNRLFAVDNGTYYSDSLKIRHNNKYLTPWVDFKPIHYFPEASREVAADCTCFFKILDTKLEGDIFLEYQVVGDKYGHNSVAIERILWSGVNDDRGVWWNNIEGLPTEWPPAPHIHDVLDFSEWQGRTSIVEQYANMLYQSHDTRLKAVQVSFANAYRLLRAVHKTTVGVINDHAGSIYNPHIETKAQVGYDKLDNYATATRAEAKEGIRSDLRLTVGGAEQVLLTAFEQYEKNVIHQGILPVSRYGNLTYLEPGVMGSYEGSGRWNQAEQRLCCLEPDGTLIRIRPGTNGISLGVYYDYAIKPFASPSLTKFVNTNVVYHPAALGRQWKPYYLRRSMTAAVIWGACYDIDKLPSITGRDFIAITGDTLDHTKHITAFLNTTYDMRGKRRRFTDEARISLIGDKVWIFDFVNGYAANEPFGFVCGYVSRKDIIDKDEVSFTMLQGPITTRGGPLGTQVDEYIKLTPTQSSRNAADNPMYLQDELTSYNIYWSRSKWWFDSDDGGKTLYAIASITSWVSTSGVGTYRSSNYRFKIDTETKVAEFPDDIRTVHAYCRNGNVSDLVIEGGGAIWDFDSTLQCGTSSYAHNSGGCYIFADGTTVSDTSQSSLNAGRQYILGRFTDTSIKNLWKTRRAGFISYGPRPDKTAFGSKAMNSLIRPMWLGDNKYTTITVNGDGDEERVRFDAVGKTDYDYKIINVGTFKGYQPSNKRYESKQSVPFAPMSYFDGKTLRLYGGVGLSLNDIGNQPVMYNQDMLAADDRVVRFDRVEVESKTKSFIESIKNQLKTKAAGADNAVWFSATIYSNPDPKIPLLATITYRFEDGIVPGRTNWATITTVARHTGSREGLVTGWVYDKDNWVFYHSNSTAASNGNYNYHYCPGALLYKKPDGTGYIHAIGGYYTTPSVSNTNLPFQCLLFDNDFKIVPGSDMGITIGANTGIVYTYPFLSHDYGFCLMNDPISSNAKGTNLVFRAIGKTTEEYMAGKNGGQLDNYVLVSQEVEKGWNVYFTEETPVILNGREFIIPNTSIDLRTVKANPANTTFWVYVEQEGDGCEYKIYTEGKPATWKRMYIGYITTSDNQIKNININKRSRLGIYQLSDRKAGTSIPVSTGHPFKNGYWDWSNNN